MQGGQSFDLVIRQERGGRSLKHAVSDTQSNLAPIREIRNSALSNGGCHGLGRHRRAGRRRVIGCAAPLRKEQPERRARLPTAPDDWQASRTMPPALSQIAQKQKPCTASRMSPQVTSKAERPRLAQDRSTTAKVAYGPGRGSGDHPITKTRMMVSFSPNACLAVLLIITARSAELSGTISPMK
jgi:hypothetical protein